ncbi:hypothetical protein Tco_0215222 [Tanacetum coccineum]
MDDALVTPTNRLKIGKCNHRLSSTLKSNEHTPQVVLDALKLTLFYKAFQITANVTEIYMQEFWATVSIHHKSLHFKINDKSHTLNLENFKYMLQIFPRLTGQKFEDPPFEEEILSFIRDLGHTREIKVLTDVNGMYQKKNVDYVYLLWEDLVKTKYKKKANEPVTPSKSKSAPTAKGTRLKAPGKVTQSGKKRKSALVPKAKGLETLSEVLEVPNEQQQKDSGTDKGAGDKPEVLDVPKYDSESDEESWTFSQDEEDADEETDVNNDSKETESNNDGDDITHPNLLTYKANDEEEEEKADDEEMSSD